MSATIEGDLVDRLVGFYRDYYRDEIGALAQHYPNEQRSLFVDFNDVYAFDPNVAEDWLGKPETVQRHAEDALAAFDLPADIDLGGAHVRLTNLPPEETFYPGGFSPKERAGEYIAVEGQLERATETYAILQEAAFECQRCGSMTYVPVEHGYQEPHECHGCERQGPFEVNLDQSDLVDGQKLRIIEPPEIAQGGDGTTIDVFVQDDLVEQAQPGDKVVVSGVLHLEQQTQNNSKTARFTPYVDAEAVVRKEAEFEDIDITPADVERIERAADSTEGDDIFSQAVGSIAPSIEDENDIKLSIFLQLISGVREERPDGTTKRGDPHVLLIGDPSTGKSELMDAAEAIAPRSVSVSGHGASASGLTAAAVRDDFGDGDWTLKAGALVHAHGGLACIDELDKIAPDAVKSMHKALSQQRIPVNKAGINATLPSETAVLGAANPKHGRWDNYTADHEQIDIDPALVSRFALIWKLTDSPDEDRDRIIGDKMLRTADVAKRIQLPDATVSDADRAEIEPELDPEFLRTYIAYARANFTPVFRDDAVRERMTDAYVALRGANGYDDEAAVPVTPRKLDDALRLAEASARARLSPVIEEQDVERAQRLVGSSLRQFGMNDDGDLDVDTVETGTSKPQKERRNGLKELIAEHQPKSGPLMIDELVDIAADEMGLDERVTRDEVEEIILAGEAYEPGAEGTVRVFSS